MFGTVDDTGRSTFLQPFGHSRLQNVEVILLNKLREWAYLPLIVERDEVIAKPAHFAIPCLHQLLFKFDAIHLLSGVLLPGKLLEVAGGFGSRSFPRELLEN